MNYTLGPDSSNHRELQSPTSWLDNFQQETNISEQTVEQLKAMFPQHIENPNSGLALVLEVSYGTMNNFYNGDDDKTIHLIQDIVTQYAKEYKNVGYTLDSFKGFVVDAFFASQEESEKETVIDETNLEIEVSLAYMKKLDEKILAFKKRIDLDPGEFQKLIEQIRNQYFTQDLESNILSLGLLQSYYNLKGKNTFMSLISTYKTKESLDNYFLNLDPSSSLDDNKDVSLTTPGEKVSWIQLQMIEEEIALAKQTSANYILNQAGTNEIIENNFSHDHEQYLFARYKEQEIFSPISHDVIPGSLMLDMNIKDASSDVNMLVRKFGYKRFLSVMDAYPDMIAYPQSRKIETSQDMLDTILIKLFKNKKILDQISSTDDVAALVSYVLITGNVPKHTDVASILDKSSSFINIWNTKKSDYMKQENDRLENENQLYIDALYEQKNALLQTEIDKMVDAIKHPKGTDKTDNIQSPIKNNWNGEKNCSVLSRLAIINILRARLGIHADFSHSLSEFEKHTTQGVVPVWKGDAIALYKLFQKEGLGTKITAGTKELLFDNIKSALPLLALQYNSNIFELYFHTGFFKDDEGKVKEKGHRVVVFLDSDGDWNVIDPIDHPEHKKTGFPLDVFFQSISSRLYENTAFINTNPAYGYLHEDTRHVFAHADEFIKNNPDAYNLAKNKLGSEEILPYLEQYKSFIPPTINNSEDVRSISLEDLQKKLPETDYIPHWYILQTIENIKDISIKNAVIGYFLSGEKPDIIGLKKFIGLGEDGDIAPSDTFDKETLDQLKLFEEESYNKQQKMDSPGAAAVDMGYTTP